MQKMRVADAMVKFLERLGVEYAFGFNGHGNWALLDSITYESSIQGIMTRREDQAVHMADGYWRMKRQGPPPIVVTTVGPGNMNIPPALANAFYDSMAMVVLAGGTPTQWYGSGALEECYRYRPEGWTDVVRPISKASWSVERPETAVELLAKAVKTAISGRPGPVVLQIPFELQHEVIPVDLEGLNPQEWTTRISSRVRPDPHVIETAVRLLLNAQRPLILAGGGVVSALAFDELRELAETFNLPVVTSFMGKGALPENHPQSLGVAGMCGTYHAFKAAGACDVLIAFGARFNDCHTSQWRMYQIPHACKLVHFDIDPEEIGRNYPVEAGAVADAKMALRDLVDALRQAKMKPLDPDGEWWRSIKEWEKEFKAKRSELVNLDWSPVHYAKAFAAVTEAIHSVDKEASVLFDTGNSQSYAPAFYTTLTPFVSTNGQFAQMGFSAAAIVGAKLARPRNAAVSVGGDGSFFMTCMAVATAVQYKIPVVWVVFNNQSLLMETELMEGAYGREAFSVYFKEPLDLTRTGKKAIEKGEAWNPDVVELAKAMGAKARKVVDPAAIGPAVREALEANEPFVVDVWINRESKGWYNQPFYFPMEFKTRGKAIPYLPPSGSIY